MVVSLSSLNFNDAEWTQIQTMARKRGLPEAAFIRDAVRRALTEGGPHDGAPHNGAGPAGDRTADGVNLRAIIDHAPEPIFIKDLAGRYVLVNPATAAAYGCPVEALLGRTDAELFPPEAARRFAEADREVLTTREQRSIEEVITMGPTQRVYRTNKFPYYSSSGELLGVIGMARDITEQKRLENALTELAQGLSASTGQTFFTSISQYLSRALGVDYVLIDEVSLQDPTLMRPVVLVRCGEVLQGFEYPLHCTPCETVFGQKFRAYPQDLASRFPEDPFLEPLALESYAGMPLFDSSGAPIGLVAVMHTAPMPNIAEAQMLLKVVAKRLEAELERKRAGEVAVQRTVELEQAKELDRLKNGFVNAVSHELRTPLTSILGYAEFLEDHVGGSLSHTQEEFVHQIQESAGRLSRLVDDLLDFARIDAGTFQLKRETLDLAPKIREIVASFRPQSSAADQVLSLTLPEQPLMANVDANRIGQVLTNLLSNALKFTPREGHIDVRALLTPEGVRVEVEDSGEGIPADDLPRLFHRFSQLESGMRKGGTGLGLSISKALVEAHGGTIGVSPVRPHGALFWFTLPTQAG
jgi:PAS domain S-box-containing protein